MLKALKIIGISLTGLIFLLGIVLYILEVKYRDAIHKKTIEIITQNFDEQFTLKDFHVSFLNRFPKLTVSVTDIEFKDSTKTLLHIGEVNFLVNLWELRNKKVVIDRITINNADLDFQVDSVGNKPHLLHKVKVKHDVKEHSVSFNMGKIYINNSKLLLGNYYKHNHTYIHIGKGIFQPGDLENDFRIKGELDGFLDSLVTNDKALIRNQPLKLTDVVLNYNKKKKELVSEKGEILAHSVIIYPHLRIRPEADGSMIDLEISSEGNISEFLNLMNFHFDTKFTLDSPNASLKFSFKQSGLVTPF
ncbi:MAG TPA: AsmA family protein, partial [Draconibacterium sp.]|nr:AsmA family protein [Draconibacterium sp.]